MDAVERAAGLDLFDDITMATSTDLCKTVKCEVIVRRFDDATKKQLGQGQGVARGRRGSSSGVN